MQVRLDKIERIFCINSGDFIPKNRKCECTNGAQTLVVWAFSDFVENLRTTISKKSSIAPIEWFLKNKVKRVEEMQSERVFKRNLCEI